MWSLAIPLVIVTLSVDVVMHLPLGKSSVAPVEAPFAVVQVSNVVVSGDTLIDRTAVRMVAVEDPDVGHAGWLSPPHRGMPPDAPARAGAVPTRPKLAMTPTTISWAASVRQRARTVAG
jgi:hypothetical protein